MSEYLNNVGIATFGIVMSLLFAGLIYLCMIIFSMWIEDASIKKVNIIMGIGFILAILGIAAIDTWLV